RTEADRLAQLVPFSPTVERLEEGLASMADVDARAAAGELDELLQAMGSADPPTDAIAFDWTRELRESVKRWKEFHLGYNPTLDWWVRQPLEQIEKQFERLTVEPKEEGVIPGRVLGRDSLLEDIALAMVPYSPEELIAIGEREYAWCLAEMKRASAELGFGDDWKSALEHVKESC